MDRSDRHPRWNSSSYFLVILRRVIRFDFYYMRNYHISTVLPINRYCSMFREREKWRALNVKCRYLLGIAFSIACHCLKVLLLALFPILPAELFPARCLQYCFHKHSHKSNILRAFAKTIANAKITHK